MRYRKKNTMALLLGLWCIAALSACKQHAQNTTTNHKAVLLISIDGLKPEYVKWADSLELEIPNLSELWTSGTHAEGVRGVLPAVTFPSHTTIITGVYPAKHGIYANQVFETNFDIAHNYYWFAEDIKVPTLWDAAAAHGYKTGSVAWPVSIGASGLAIDIPPFGMFSGDLDLKMTHGFSKPDGLMEDISQEVGAYVVDNSDLIARDRARFRYIMEIIKRDPPDFFTIHFTAADGLQHRNGPFTAPVYEGLSVIDDMVGEVSRAFQQAYPNSTICVVSDHGFSKVSKYFNLYAPFVEEGLITLEKKGSTIENSEIKDWIAMPIKTSGSAAICLKEPQNQQHRQRVEDFLKKLAANPAYGVDVIWNSEDIARLGGSTEAVYWIGMEPGFNLSTSLQTPWVREVEQKGTHGFSPELPEMAASFLIKGEGIRENHNLGTIDMRSIAPTLAEVMGVPLPTADLPPLEIFVEQAL